MSLKENLDKRICDVALGAENTQTYREFIRQSEDEFGIEHVPIDEFTDEELEDYLNFLDELWDK
ncbi:hypothetical protein [Clostridium kluyveri]|uniref:hypothetical protein n=1 Tax=Clostridium kluyveri TaxID=1534 RepID=UPI0022482DAB|nr:hypothetical protein [Clostridium kluyveri]UZQ49829.1 hypothetical protein OP486_18065 [Clostridium kluyveri]